MHFNYGFHENIATPILFIDGLTRSGKTMFCSIISSMEKMEHIQFFSLLEQVIPAVGLKSLDVSYAKALLRVAMNELAYNLKISRHVNFRYLDHSGILNYHNPHLYFERLAKPEGQEVIEELRKRAWRIPFLTHDLMVNLDSLDQMDMDYKMVQLYRHPVDNIYSWWTRGWGERFIDDPQSFTLSIQHDGKLLPWYCVGYEAEWISYNPIERCIKTFEDLIYKSVMQQKNASNPSRIHMVTFENFVQNPNQELHKIADFLNTSTTSMTEHFIGKARCPRELKTMDRIRKMHEIKSNVRERFYSTVECLASEYENNLYGLQ